MANAVKIRDVITASVLQLFSVDFWRQIFGAISYDLDLAVVDVAAIRTRSNLAMLSPAGLAIGGGAKLKAQAAKPITALVAGTLVFKPAATEMSALAGTIADTKYALWAFYIDSAGTITTSAKTADAATAAAAFALMPALPASKVQIGFIIVGTSGATFIGATTALDAGTATVIYVDTVGLQTAPVALTFTTANRYLSDPS